MRSDGNGDDMNLFEREAIGMSQSRGADQQTKRNDSDGDSVTSEHNPSRVKRCDEYGLR
jgi:hypothetical protein